MSDASQDAQANTARDDFYSAKWSSPSPVGLDQILDGLGRYYAREATTRQSGEATWAAENAAACKAGAEALRKLAAGEQTSGRSRGGTDSPPPGDPERGGAERCFICLKAFRLGDMVLPDETEGLGHRACFGEDREGYTLNGEPLPEGEPIPAGYPWEPETVAASDAEASA